MKFALRGVRTDFPPEIVKGKTREAFISQWSKSTWQKAPVAEREQVLGEVWDILTPKDNSAINIDLSNIIAKSESAATALKELDEATEEFLNKEATTKSTRKTGKKNGVQADTKEPEAVRPDEGNGGDNQPQSGGDNEAESETA